MTARSPSDIRYLNLSSHEKKQFVELFHSYLPQTVLDAGMILQAVDSLILSLDELADPAVCKNRASRFNLGLDLNVFAERIIHRGGGNKVVIAGLRFRKLRAEFPFIHITANFTPHDADLAVIKKLVLKEFPGVSPRGLTFRQGPGLKWSTPYQNWSHTLWGETKQQDAHSLASQYQLRSDFNAECFSVYEAEYQKFLCQNLERAEYLGIEEQADLEAGAKAGLALSLFDEHGWAGVIAGRNDEFYGYPCLYIFEFFLSERLRGKGLAKSLEKYFLNKVSNRYKHVFGHIHDTNKPSLKTALAVGRVIVETEYFIPF